MALPTHLTLEIVTPERPLVQEAVDEVTLPGVHGHRRYPSRSRNSAVAGSDSLARRSR